MKLQRTCSKVNNVIINSPMLRGSPVRTQDVGEGKMSTKNTLLLHTKLFRALRNGSGNAVNTRKWISFASSRSSRTFFVPPTRSKSDSPMCSQPVESVNRWSRPEGLWQPEDGGNTHWEHPRETADPRFAWTTGEPRPVERSRLPKY